MDRSLRVPYGTQFPVPGQVNGVSQLRADPAGWAMLAAGIGSGLAALARDRLDRLAATARRDLRSPRAPARQRSLARGLRRRAVAGRAALVAGWLGTQAACWQWQLNRDWTAVQELGHEGLAVLMAIGTLLAVGLLWGTLEWLGETAAWDRTVAATAYAAIGTGLVAVVMTPQVAPGTVITVFSVSVSPLLSRSISALLRTRWPQHADVVPSASPGSPRRLLSTGASPAQWPTTRALPEPSVARGPQARICYAAIDLVHRCDLGDITRLADAPRHVGLVKVTGSAYEQVVKLFGTPVQGRQQLIADDHDRNPRRPLGAYRSLLSRIGALTPEERRLADRVLLWPSAVLAENEEAVGVLYPRLATPFLLRGGSAQTGVYLLAEEPEFSGCQVLSGRQRGEVLLDVVVGHELLHRLGLAHGDTNWRNFVYGIEEGRGRGRVIDVDGISSVDDVHPLLLHQPDWGDDPRCPPVVRDVHRIALLTARLAGREPSWDCWQMPPLVEEWASGDLRAVTSTALSSPEKASLAEFAQVLRHGLHAVADEARRSPATWPGH